MYILRILMALWVVKNDKLTSAVLEVLVTLDFGY